MTNLRKLALAASFPVTFYACATALEIEDDLDIVSATSTPPLLAAGGGGLGGGMPGGGGASLGGSNVAAAGSGIGGDMSNGAGGGAGGNGAAGDGAGSAGASAAGAGGGGNAGAGMGGADMTGGGGMANLGGADMGGAAGAEQADAGVGGGGETAESVFDPAACNFTDLTNCDADPCSQCNSNDCEERCEALQDCVVGGGACITVEDPVCAVRVGTMNVENTCTSETEQGGGVGNPQANSPAAYIYEWVDCMCQTGRLD